MSKRTKYMVEMARKTAMQNEEDNNQGSLQNVLEIERVSEHNLKDEQIVNQENCESETLQTNEQLGDEMLESSKDLQTIEQVGDEMIATISDNAQIQNEDSSLESESIDDPFSSDDSIRDKTYYPSREKTYYTFSDSESDNFDDNDDEAEITLNDRNFNNNVQAAIAPDEGVRNDTGNADEWHDITEDEEEAGLSTKKSTLSNFIDKSQIKNPLDVFNFFITDEVLDIIVNETNEYAVQQLEANHSRKSRLKLWKQTNRSEIRTFLGVTIAMGLTKVSHINLYWSKDALFCNKFISSVMTRDRYLLLLKLLHFDNNRTADVTNRLYKIEKVLSRLVENFQKVLNPGNTFVIDESMVPFQGRLHFRQYLPNKTHKYGIKLYKLCSPEAYTFNVIVYTGKGETMPELGHSQSVVLKLLQGINKAGNILFADNFYSSIPLAENLLRENMFYCGTLRVNRKGVPKDFNAKKKMKRGETFGKERNGIKIIQWMDKRPVLMITTDPSHNTRKIVTGKKNRQGEEILKPKCITDYNAAKKGVDVSDQMSSYHTVLRRSIKWYR